MSSELADLIRAVLRDLQPSALYLEDQSAAHAGHVGARAGAHFRLEMTSAAFGGLATLERHRLVNEKLAPLFQGRIHALSMRLWAPGEAGAR